MLQGCSTSPYFLDRDIICMIDFHIVNNMKKEMWTKTMKKQKQKEDIILIKRERQRIPKGQSKWAIQRSWQHRVHKTKTNKTKTQHNTICVGHHYAQTSITSVNKT